MKKIQTQEKIEKSTLELIDKKPFQEISTKQIASQAGVSEMTIFRHFSSKDKILDRLSKFFFKLIIGFDSNTIKDENHFRTELIKFFKKSISSSPMHRKLFKVFLYIGMYKKEMFLKYADIYEYQIAGPIEQVVEYGIKNWGYNKNLDVEISVKLLINSIGFFNIVQNVFLLRKKKPYDLNKVIEISVDNFIKTLK